MKILTAAQMGEVDRLTTERYNVPGILLMENAAARTVEAVEEKLDSVTGKRALIVCGRGNNGGDGAAIARQLYIRGASVDLLLLGRIDDAKGDARTNFEIARRIASDSNREFRLIEIENAGQFHEEARKQKYDIFFDAVLGTGLSRPAAGLYEEAINFLNDQSDQGFIVAVDIPSGIDSDSAELPGPAVIAHLTVTFTAPKIASVLPPASLYGGELIVGRIGSPDGLINSSGSRLSLVEQEMVEEWLALSRRSPQANKGDAGKVLVVAGSQGKTGAACLVGESALRAGAGLVTVATPEGSQKVVAARILTECMTEPLAETDSGTVSREAIDRALELASTRDVLALGPGLGSSEESTRTFVHALVMRRTCPAVIDADGLNSLVPWAENLRGSRELPLILTPHPGEMARLTGKEISEVIKDRVEIARDFATAHSVIVVLKGSRTLIASPDGEVFVNPTGNSGMATGGTGDVLTGIIASLVAQRKDDPLAATIAAVYLHGLAGDLAASRAGIRAMIASDISAHIGDAFMETGGDQERL